MIKKKEKILNLIDLSSINMLFFCIFFFKNVVGFFKKKKYIVMFLHYAKILQCLTVLKLNLIVKFNSLVDLFVKDNLSFFFRFEVFYSFWNYNLINRIFLKIFVNKLLFSVGIFYKSSYWLEREIWDMFGLRFLYHIDLRKILLDYNFLGHPLKKDFPLVGYFELRYNDLTQLLTAEPVELSQNVRYFDFGNPWNLWKG